MNLSSSMECTNCQNSAYHFRSGRPIFFFVFVFVFFIIDILTPNIKANHKLSKLIRLNGDLFTGTRLTSMLFRLTEVLYC